MRRLLLTLLLTIFSVTAALAEGKITQDPNAPGAKPPAAIADDEQAGDKRLAQKITYEARKKTVVEIMADLAKMSGVTFKAGANSADWQVRDRRMNVFAKDVPLARLMSSLARVMHFKWSRTGEKEATVYRLISDQRTIRESEAKAEANRQTREQRQAERRQRALDAYGRTANMTPDELAKLKQESPLLYFCAAQGLTGAMASFLKEAPGAAEALANGQKLSLNSADLSPAGQQALLASFTSMNRIEQKFGGGRARELPASLASNLGKVSIEINKNLEMVSQHPGTSFMLGEVALRYSEGGENGESTSQHLPIFDPDSAMAKVIGKTLLKCEESGLSMEEFSKEIGKEIESELGKTLIEEMKQELPSESKTERPPDPDLDKKVKLEGVSGSDLVDLLPVLAKASEYAVVSDSFGRTHRLPGTTFSEGELKTILDGIGGAYLYDWDKHGPVIELRDRDWLRKRAAQIPEAWLEYWRAKYKEDKTLDLAELAKMAALTTEQLVQNIMSDEVLRDCYSSVVPNREILKLYACLTDAQRQALLSESGLDLRSLGPNQWPFAESAMQSQNSALLQNSNTPLLLAYNRRQTSKSSVHHEFSVEVDGVGKASWVVGLHEYHEPEAAPTPDPKSDQLPEKDKKPEAKDK